MNNGKNLRITLTGAIVALVAAVPGAEAKQAKVDTGVSVCNQATHTSVDPASNMVADDGDRGPAARYQTNLIAKPGNGRGLVRAAANSPALTLCSAPAVKDTTVVVVTPPPVVVTPPIDTATPDSGGLES